MKLWKEGDRVQHRETGELATVTEFYQDSFFDSGYFCRLEPDEKTRITEEYGDWRAVREDWKLLPK